MDRRAKPFKLEAMLLLVLLLLPLAAASGAGVPRRSLRAAAPGPTPAPFSALSMPSGKGADAQQQQCEVAGALLPVALQLAGASTIGALQLCSMDSEQCEKAIADAASVMSTAVSSLLVWTAAEGLNKANCSSDVILSSMLTYSMLQATFQETCDATVAGDAGFQVASVLAFDTYQLLAGLRDNYDVSQEDGLAQASSDLAAALQMNFQPILASAANACPTVNIPSTPPEVPPPVTDSSSTPDTTAPPAFDPSQYNNDLGEWGAAALPALEDARHFAFMSIIGRRRR